VKNPLAVASAYPDPPFDLILQGRTGGFDVELMRELTARLGLQVQTVRYDGDDFNGIFDGLASGAYDAVISGTTITPDRAARVLFSQPYLEFGQGVAVAPGRHPAVRSEDDLGGFVVGIQQGNTSDAVARRLLSAGKIGRIRYYPYHGIDTMLDDLLDGTLDAVIKLHPVLAWLVRARPGLAVVMEVPTHERLGIAFSKENSALCEAVNGALEAAQRDGAFAALQAKYFAPAGRV
jgi:ABC-type amino acid transport substrate-binding protein